MTQLSIKSFMLRPDNSVEMPGKRDVIKVGKCKLQKHNLTDTLDNLYKKYKAEQPHRKVSIDVFRKCRPKNCIPVMFVNRKLCLCKKHQNFALKARAARSLGLGFAQSPDKFCEDMSVDEVTERLSMIKNVRVVKFERWEKEDVVYGKDTDKSSSRNHLAKKEEPFEQFCAGFIQEMNEFKMHASRVAGQYAAIQELKQRLPVNHATIQMDFAENFRPTCD